MKSKRISVTYLYQIRVNVCVFRITITKYQFWMLIIKNFTLREIHVIHWNCNDVIIWILLVILHCRILLILSLTCVCVCVCSLYSYFDSNGKHRIHSNTSPFHLNIGHWYNLCVYVFMFVYIRDAITLFSIFAYIFVVIKIYILYLYAPHYQTMMLFM